VSKRKTSALRQKDTRYSKNSRSENAYYNESKTIDFNQHQPKRATRPIELIPQTVNQEKYIVNLTDPNIDIVVVSGPAGTGKTYLAMLAAIQAMRRGECDKILLTRPAVPADEESHGFLPGDLNQKMEPWVRPLFDVLREYYSAKELEYMVNEQIIEITPLAYCRGRTFKHSWIICDEMQNATPSQTKMIMTRIGEGSKLVITGDTLQADRKNPANSLIDLTERLKKNSVPGLSQCFFDHGDIRRHKIIGHILKLYGE
jgi:phosphate starvation-inducible protein PhoH and related proteins